MSIEKKETPSNSIVWTETSPNSKLNEIERLLKDNSGKKLIRKLSEFLEQQDYVGFQEEVGLTGNDVDGKLGIKTYNKLEEYIGLHMSRFSLFNIFNRGREKKEQHNEEYIERTDKSPKSKLEEIIEILEKNKGNKKINELLLLVQGKKYKDLQKNIGMSDKDCDGKLGEKTLRYLKKHIDTIGAGAGKVMLENDMDRTGKYRVYSYIVKTGGQPKHIRREYIKQIGGEIEGIKITDDKGVEYDENTNFKSNDKVFIKVPIEFLDNMSKDTKEKVKMQEDYIEGQKDDRKEMLQRFNRQHPMGKDVKFSFGMPVYEYGDIDKTLRSITTNQENVDPKTYEVVILLNKPNKDAPSPDKTQQKIEKFKKEHPEYNICVFEKTFNFKKDENGKYKVNYGKLYKVLGDTIVYRNIQRKNIGGMDMKKIRDLIIKTGAADSTDKNPKYIENQLNHYSHLCDGKELVRMIGESRLPKEVCLKYPLIEILEFFQRHFDNEYAGGPLNRNVGVGTYKAWTYSGIKGFDGINYPKGEDKDLINRIRKYVKKPENTGKIGMYHDDFVGAVDESCDRGIWGMVEKGISYCDRYDYKEGDIASKQKNWNTFAIEHKGESKFEVLELTVKNLEKNLSAYYKQKITSIFNGKVSSKKYHGYTDEKTGKYVPGYKDSDEFKKATKEEKYRWIADNVVNPKMEITLERPDFMGLDKNDYSLLMDSEGNPQIKFKESAIEKIKRIQQTKIRDGYYDYRK